MTTMTRPNAVTPATPAARAVRFLEPLLGFDGHLDFGMVPIDPEGVLIALRSLTDAALRFVLTPAELFFADYDPPVAGVAAALGAEPADVQVLVLLTITGDLADATANLRAPVLVAPGAGTAVQVVLDDDTLSMRAPILPVAAPGAADLA